MLKKLFIIAVIIVFLVGALLGFALYNANQIITKYTPELERLASNALGREVKFGALTTSLFPPLSIEIKDLSLGTPTKGKERISIQGIKLKVKLLALLKKELDIELLSVLNPEITLLEQRGEARTPKESNEKPLAKEEKPLSSSPVSSNASDFKIHLRHIEILNGRVSKSKSDIEVEEIASEFSLSTAVELMGQDINLSKLTLRTKALKKYFIELSAKALNFNGSEFKFPELNIQTLGSSLKVAGVYNLTEQQLTLESLTGDLIGGSIQGDLVSQFNEISPFKSNLKVGNLVLSKIYDTFLVPKTSQKITGTLESFEAQINGKLSQIPASVSGKVFLHFKDGALIGENIAGKVLKTISNLPFLSGSLFDMVPPEDKKALESGETQVKHLTGNFLVQNQKLQTQDFSLQSNLFDLEATGSVGFDNAGLNPILNLRASILFHPEFSSGIASKVKEVKVLFNEQGKLVIPLELKGNLSNLSVLPDTKKLLEGAGTRLIKEKALDAVEGILKGDKKTKGFKDLLGF